MGVWSPRCWLLAAGDVCRNSCSLAVGAHAASETRLSKLVLTSCLCPQEQAAEREHEREDFQQEINQLQEQLRQATRLQPQSPPDNWVGQLWCALPAGGQPQSPPDGWEGQLWCALPVGGQPLPRA